jgi:hypothetical protein
MLKKMLTAHPHAATFEPYGNALFKLTLTPENKAELFEYAISKLSQSQHEALSILQNLTKWDSYSASLFIQRSPSTILNTPFRLIFPNSALPSFDDTGLYVRQYIAVSYCWRSEEFLPKGYERYGDWPISKPFVDAILSDKDHDREGIWMDQLCIDQSSSIDKQESVAAMDIMYRSCIRLLVLLEDVFLDEREAALHEKYDPTKMEISPTWRPPSDERAVFESFYHKVNAARWWERAWCFHEFNVHEPWSEKRQRHTIHNATFVMNGPRGSTVKIKWYCLQVIMGYVGNYVSEAANIKTEEFKGHGIFAGIERADRDRASGWRSSLMARHNVISRKGCLHLADRLSIMINMCGLGLAFMGRYLKSKEELLYMSALLALAAGEVYPLTMFDSSLPPIMLNDKPTWLSRHFIADDTSIPKFKLRDLNGIHRISTEEIELDMVFLSPPAVWVKVEDEDLESTYEIFPETIITTQPTRYVSIEGTKPIIRNRSDTLLDQPRRRFLAGCLMSGQSFTTRLWAQLKRDVVVPEYNNNSVVRDLAPNPSLRSAAQKFIAQLQPISTLLCIPPSPTFTVEDAHLFLTWLTDPRSMYYINTNTNRVQCTVDHQGAFSTAAAINEHFYDGPSEELRAAVPTDLLHATCIPLRVWILRPAKGDKGEGKWRIVGKALLLGEPDLMSEARVSGAREDAVVRLEKRTVVGG